MKSEISIYEKIDFEWNNFVMDTLLGSREKIFSAAEEIVTRRKICQALKRITVIDEETHKKLIEKNNLLDSVYLFVKEDYEETGPPHLQDSVKKWVELYLD